MNQSTRSQLILHSIVFIWGFTGILGKLMSIASLDIVWYRMGLAALIIFPFIKLIRRQPIIPDTQSMIKFLTTGIIVLGHWYFFFKAMKVSTVSVGIICMGTTTFFTALIEPIFFKRKVLLQEIILGTVAALGIILIFGVVPVQYYWGVIYGLFASVMAATFTVINGYFVDLGHRSTMITFWEMLGGFLGATIIFTVLGDLDASFFQLSYTDTWGVLFIGVICTAIAFIVSVEVMKHLTPFTVSITINMEPVYTIFLALLVFGEKEHQSWGFYVGSVIILGAIFTNANLKKRRRKRAGQP